MEKSKKKWYFSMWTSRSLRLKQPLNLQCSSSVPRVTQEGMGGGAGNLLFSFLVPCIAVTSKPAINAEEGMEIPTANASLPRD